MIKYELVLGYEDMRGMRNAWDESWVDTGFFYGAVSLLLLRKGLDTLLMFYMHLIYL
jgi:hypothetical protein